MRARPVFRIAIIVLIDLLILATADIIAIFVGFDFSFLNIPGSYLALWKTVFIIQAAITLLLFGISGMYRYVWHFVGINEVAKMTATILIANVLFIAVKIIFGFQIRTGVAFISCLFQLVLFLAERCSLRIMMFVSQRLHRPSSREDAIMIIGGGEAGRLLIREIAQNDKIHGFVACIIDDNPRKKGSFLEGVRIIGGRGCIEDAVKKYSISRIILAIPRADAKDRNEILQICNKTGCRVQMLPRIDQIVDQDVSLSSLHNLRIEDLLEREPIQLDLSKLSEFLGGKTVLVTGGGGSIGSELCRQIAKHKPKKLVVVDIYENNAYDLQQELIRTYGGDLNLSVEIASVRDAEKMRQIFGKHRPQIVFHAAAHKHVPLMENCPEEAVKNNVFGTYNVCNAAEEFGVEKFVMISTDKAVNPTNFMGATKRFCEMILQSRADSKTEFVAVRFGNVLGSNGSVVPLFQKQIAAGGPITLTDKRIIRYFMTIPEAAQLVLDAGAMAKRNQVFVLDMGEPVKILSLAENLIRLQGLKPYRDIDIVEIGLRPGEKLYEELLIQGENLDKTSNKKIFVEQQREISRETMRSYLDKWQELLDEKATPEQLIAQMREFVSTYHKPEEVNAYV